MTEQAPISTTFFKGWENYQQAFVESIAPLSSAQLALPVAAHHCSIGELLAHLISARIAWFSGWMGEGDSSLAHWNDDGQCEHDAARLVAMFEKTWHMISSAVSRWTSADLARLFPPPAAHQAWLKQQGFEEEPAHTREWIYWHVLEHEIHHGGELSLALGAAGLESFYTW